MSRAHLGYAALSAAPSRGVIVHRHTLALSVGAFALVLAWAVGLSSYVFFRDEVLSGLARRHHDVASAYEDRIAELKDEVEKARTRRLVEHEQFERRIEGLSVRQAAIEQRQQLISALTKPPTPQTRAEAPRPVQPISDTVRLKPAGEREARLESRVTSAAAHPAAPAEHGSAHRLASLHQSLDRAELAQAAALNRIESEAETRSRRMRAVLDDIGLAPSRAATEAPMGGPFVPAAVGATFEAQAARVAAAVDDMRRLEQTVDAVPLRRPIHPDADVTSGFGTRIDPFLRRPALHGGIDFRAETGAPVRATARGRVKEASWQSGFGNMVEVSHDNGLSTVFAHLSAIDVREGDAVVPGQIVGRLGSTGRSTGPHLHYETRIAGEPVDPQRFLRAGVRLGLAEPQ
ncbi:M23 family metallopeptidase [Blastochloris viridis]|uniref:Glycyl-glycine endopeptidase ALE-1 n=1 Tax=Blastochloris viridis TaxID=1079 RepID=A0A0H5B6C2_BLAVI|nr:M23 family metallopeptidase [Blastochloris viridis]ALK08912.1 Glycyl-glycine endopeptidase ALE-1 precursor [Blastochloris viridis]BAR97692.1 membrane protein related to metalloendopeptidases [Blastochloris viridis]CUU41573.1 Glycyl-glycine endopeptidase ALE-1 precursor [Blastochloris viridis]